MPNTPPVAPLPVAVELARSVEGEWSGEIGHVERDAALIDAKVRPLVEALRGLLNTTDLAFSPEQQSALDAARDALRSAGDE